MASVSVQTGQPLAKPAMVVMPTRRDSILDAIRGLCLVLMTVNHLPANCLQRVTYQPLGFISAFEIFVFLSGLVTVWVYGTVWNGSGVIAFGRRVVRGAGRIYVVSMGATLLLVLVTALGGKYFSVWRPLVLVGRGSWWEFLLSLVTFRHTIAFISILRFYCWLLCLIPAILFLLRKGWERALVALSITVWVAMQLAFARHSYAGSGMFVSLLQLACWQPLYVLGSIIGYRRCTGSPSLIRTWKPLLPVVVPMVATLFVLRQQFPFATPGVLRFLAQHAWIADKQTLGPLRLLDFVAILVVASVAVQKFRPAIQRLALYRPLAFLGENSLYVYLWSMGTTYLGLLFGGQWAALDGARQSAWVLLAVMTLWVAAGLNAWCAKSRKDGGAAQRRVPESQVTLQTIDWSWVGIRTR